MDTYVSHLLFVLKSQGNYFFECKALNIAFSLSQISIWKCLRITIIGSFETWDLKFSPFFLPSPFMLHMKAIWWLVALILLIELSFYDRLHFFMLFLKCFAKTNISLSVLFHRPLLFSSTAMQIDFIWVSINIIYLYLYLEYQHLIVLTASKENILVQAMSIDN